MACLAFPGLQAAPSWRPIASHSQQLQGLGNLVRVSYGGTTYSQQFYPRTVSRTTENVPPGLSPEKRSLSEEKKGSEQLQCPGFYPLTYNTDYIVHSWDGKTMKLFHDAKVLHWQRTSIPNTLMLSSQITSPCLYLSSPGKGQKLYRKLMNKYSFLLPSVLRQKLGPARSKRLKSSPRKHVSGSYPCCP